ncbi:LOW QUALITY PROTEIN: ceramide synthase-like, partial [Heptranchias perlo]|uniref:LOW QUALITY PROTEIN: ceramide synthase-like n=1 Tax=Heptranchias perlo TaxID=212740 RepID=UPI003559C110
HWLANAYVLFAVPYFAYDIYAMYLCHWYKYMVKGHEAHTLSKRTVLTSYLRKELLMIVHHTVMFAVCFPVSVFLRNGRGDFFVGCMFMAEVSTPFVCLGKVLIQYRQQHTLLHKLNGVMMLATFFVCRILLFPYMYWVYGQQTELPFHRVPIELPIQCNIGVLLLMAPQIYWFFLICRGAFRLFRKTKSKEQHLNGYVALAPAPPTAPPTVPEDQKPV